MHLRKLIERTAIKFELHKLILIQEESLIYFTYFSSSPTSHEKIYLHRTLDLGYILIS